METIRWIVYPILIVLSSMMAEVCHDPNALIFKECKVNSENFIINFLTMMLILEIILYKVKKNEELETAQYLKRKAEEDDMEAERRSQEIQKQKDEFINSDKQERIRICRTDIIKKLGSVSNYLDHLTDSTYSEKQGLIRQQIAIELNQIVAKYQLADLREVIKNNEEIQYKLNRLKEKFNFHSIENDDLELMLRLLVRD